MNDRAVEPLPLPTPPLRFGPYLLDVDGCALSRQNGSEIALTRSEYTLLREFVRCPGRVLSRDHLLDVLAGRRSEPFDRSVDMLVARLRRKIEPDQKRATLIVTVPGQGYKLAVPVNVGAQIAVAAVDAIPAPAANGPAAPARLSVAARGIPLRPRLLAVAVVAVAVVAAGAWSLRSHGRLPALPPVVAVLPFANLSGDPSQDYLGSGLAIELSTLLGTFPALRVVLASSPEHEGGHDLGVAEAAKITGARYVLQGSVNKGGDRVRVTAQLYQAAEGVSVWSEHFDATGRDIVAIQADIADRLYQSLAGFDGSIQRNEAWANWRKTTPTLEEFDYYVRGLPFFHRLTPEDELRAREIWQAGLIAFPDSALLRIKIAFTYLEPVTLEQSENPKSDIDHAWKLTTEAVKGPPSSALATWFGHWMMAFLYQWHDHDFVRSVDEAHAALAMAPYDPLSRSDLSSVLASAGRFQEAGEAARWSTEHEPGGPSWFFSNLAWTDYLLGRYEEVLKLQHDRHDIVPTTVAVAAVRLGRMTEAKEAIAAALKINPHDTVALEGSFPLVEPYRKALMDDLRAAGLPEG